ncbi:MAG: response regulator [Parvularculaceae bacterium]
MLSKFMSYLKVRLRSKTSKSDSITIAQLHEFVESMAGGLSVFDDEFKIIVRNDAAVEMSGLPVALWAPGVDIRVPLAIGIKYGVYRDFDCSDKFMDVLKKQITKTGEFQSIRYQVDGAIVSETYRSVKSGGFVAIYTDITQVKQREEELERLSRELRQQSEVAEAANRAKSEFLANMSHEIRTPMNGVLGMAELLTATDLDEKQQVFVETIYNSGSTLVTIINDILDFSKIEAGKLQLDPTPFSISEAVEDVALMLSSKAHEKNIELVVRCPSSLPKTLEGDAGRIRQILTNLVGNAIKFTHEGYVLINVSAAIQGDLATLKIYVEDTGIGIPADKIEAVFDKFSQAEGSTTRRFGGTGLGLAITKSLVDAMDGTIELQSDFGTGSTFTIELDLPIVEAEMVVPERAVSLNDVPILVVDDLPVNRQILDEQLTSWGACAHVVESGAQALAKLREAAAAAKPFPLAILDFHMPTMDGLELAHHIRNDPAIAQTKLIILSSIDNDTISKSVRDLEVTDVLSKPVRSSLLIEALCKALTGAQIDVLRSVIPKSERVDELTSSPAASRILIAEDNLVNRMVIENMIDAARYDIVFAENGKVAFDAVREGDFDAILMDISMPEMDGIEATKAIRSFETAKSKPRTPIIALTAHAMQGDKDRFIDAGMDDYLTKPVRKQMIAQSLEKWTAKSLASDPTKVA